MATDDIGVRIKRERERRRWTQQQLADALGVDRKTVDNWENGRAKPRSSIGAIEEVLGARVAYGEKEPELPGPEQLDDLRDHIREVLGEDAAARMLAALDAEVDSRGGRNTGAGARPPTRRRAG